MNDLPYLKCANPDCRNAARDGHVCAFHAGVIYADRTHAAVRFIVTATDPDRDFVVRPFIVRALSTRQAQDAARAELTKEQRDHWSLTTDRRVA